jgi:hypothetical protein
MPPLTRKRREINFCGVIGNENGKATVGAAVADGEAQRHSAEGQRAMELLESACEVAVVEDNRTGEIVLLHRASGTLVMSDLLYKSNPDMVGPGGGKNQYSQPEWFAEGQEELFYKYPGENSGGLLPSYRTHPRMRTIDNSGMRNSLEKILAWDIKKAAACHVDPMDGPECRELLKKAWGWCWTE